MRSINLTNLPGLFAIFLWAISVANSAIAADQTAPCLTTSDRVEVIEASIAAEINAHGDLLLLLDSDGDERIDEAFQAATNDADALKSFVDSIEQWNQPTRLLAERRNRGAYNALAFATGTDHNRWMLRVYPHQCTDASRESEIRLRALAHTRFRDDHEAIDRAVQRLREQSLRDTGFQVD